MAATTMSLSSSSFSTFTAPHRQTSSARQRCACRRQQMQPARALFGGGKEGGGGNPFGDMGKLMENMKKAQEVVQREAAQLQDELRRTNFEGFSEDETVCVVMNGNQQPVSCDITSEGYEQGAEKLSQLVTEAMKDAHEKSSDAMKEKMRGLASSLGLPQNTAF